MTVQKTQKHFNVTSPKLGTAGGLCYDSYPTIQKKMFWNFNWKWQLGSIMYFCLPYILGSRNRKERFPLAWTTGFLLGFSSQIWRPYKDLRKLKRQLEGNGNCSVYEHRYVLNGWRGWYLSGSWNGIGEEFSNYSRPGHSIPVYYLESLYLHIFLFC